MQVAQVIVQFVKNSTVVNICHRFQGFFPQGFPQNLWRTPCYPASSHGGATILVVEDEAAIAEVLEYNLRKEGSEVAVEYRGDTVLNAFRSAPLDLVVLDLMLPGLGG